VKIFTGEEKEEELDRVFQFRIEEGEDR